MPIVYVKVLIATLRKFENENQKARIFPIAHAYWGFCQNRFQRGICTGQRCAFFRILKSELKDLQVCRRICVISIV